MNWNPFRRSAPLDDDKTLAALERGEQARTLTQNPTLLDAINWSKERALQSLRESTGPDEAWQAALALQAAEQFDGVLHAFLAGGEMASKRMATEHERMHSERQRSASATEYGERAARARKEFAA